MNRREFTLAAAGGVLGAMNPRLSSLAFAEDAEATFSRATVVEAAKKLAETEHCPPARVPEPFNTLGYDQYRDVQFRGDRSFWINEKRGFALDLLHAGFIYEMPVEINVVEDGIVKPVTYDPGFFDFAGLPLPSWPGAPLFSGIRLR